MPITLRAMCVVTVTSVASAQSPRFVYPTSAPVNVQHVGALDIYTPPGGAARHPVAIFFAAFGGAEMRHNAQFGGWGRVAAAHGIVAIVAEDIDSALAYVERLKMRRVAVVAWSAHAGVGLPLVEDAKREAIKAAVIYYGYGPVARFRLDLPVLLVRAGLDQPAGNASIDALVAGALRANAPWTVINYPSGHHGFDVVDDNAESRAIIDRTLAFIRTALADSVPAPLGEAEAAGAAARGDYADAAARYAGLVAADTTNARLRLAYGNALLGAQRYHDARAQFERGKALGGLGARDLGIPAARASALDRDPDGAIAWLRTIPSQFLPESAQHDSAFASLSARADFQALFQH